MFQHGDTGARRNKEFIWGEQKDANEWRIHVFLSMSKLQMTNYNWQLL
jgi:hypothetical protein